MPAGKEKRTEVEAHSSDLIYLTGVPIRLGLIAHVPEQADTFKICTTYTKY